MMTDRKTIPMIDRQEQQGRGRKAHLQSRGLG